MVPFLIAGHILLLSHDNNLLNLFRSCSDVVMGNLEMAESMLDDTYAANEKEKKLRYKTQNMFIAVHLMCIIVSYMYLD